MKTLPPGSLPSSSCLLAGLLGLVARCLLLLFSFSFLCFSSLPVVFTNGTAVFPVCADPSFPLSTPQTALGGRRTTARTCLRSSGTFPPSQRDVGASPKASSAFSSFSSPSSPSGLSARWRPCIFSAFSARLSPRCSPRFLPARRSSHACEAAFLPVGKPSRRRTPLSCSQPSLRRTRSSLPLATLPGPSSSPPSSLTQNAAAAAASPSSLAAAGTPAVEEATASRVCPFFTSTLMSLLPLRYFLQDVIASSFSLAKQAATPLWLAAARLPSDLLPELPVVAPVHAVAAALPYSGLSGSSSFISARGAGLPCSSDGSSAAFQLMRSGRQQSTSAALAFLPFFRRTWGRPTRVGLPRLLAFVGYSCPYCAKMLPVEKAVESWLPGTQIRRFEVWHNPSNFALLQQLDRGGRCGGLPFYFNMRTLQWICGGTNAANLYAWAADMPCRPRDPPPLEAEDLEALNRRTGMFARMMRRVDRLRQEGERAMQQSLLQQREREEMQRRGTPPAGRG